MFSVREDNNGDIYYNHKIEEAEAGSPTIKAGVNTSTSEDSINYNKGNIKYFVKFV